MKSLHLWIIGGLVAVMAAARFGATSMEQGTFPGSVFVALSPVASSASSEVFNDPPPTNADIAVTITSAFSVDRSTLASMAHAYDLAVANKGGAVASNVRAVLPIPAGFTFEDASLPGCSAVGGTVLCDLGTLPNGQTTHVSVTFRMPAVEVCVPQSIQYRAMAWSDVFDSNNANNQSAATTIVNCPNTTSSDLELRAFFPSPVQAGSPLVFDISVFNDGGIISNDFIVVAELPGILTTHSQPDEYCTQDNPSDPERIECSFEPLNPNETQTRHMEFLTVDIPCNTMLNYQIYIMQDGEDADSSNNSISATTTVQCSSSSPNISSSSSASSQSSSVSSYNDWPWPSSSSRPSSASSASSVMTDIVVRSETAPTVNKGGTVFYDLVVTNTGRDAAPNVAVSIFGNFGLYITFLPDQSDLRCTPSTSTMVTCQLGNINPFEEIRVRLAATLQFQCNTTYNVQALTNYIGTDINQTNNRLIIGTNVQCPSSASSVPPPFSSSVSSVRSWSSIAASAGADVTARVLNNPTPVRGETYIHTIELANNGPEAAISPWIDYPLTQSLQFDATQSDSRCRLNGFTVQCTTPSLTARTTTSFRIAVKTSAQMNCTNQDLGINARTTGIDPISTNNQTMAVVQVQCQSTQAGDKVDVQVVAQHMNSKVAQGATIPHLFRVDNNGPSVATNVTLTEQIPNGFSYVDGESDARCDQSGNNVVCTLPRVGVFEPTDVKVVLRAGNEQPCGITQGTVTVAGGGQETNSFNNTITVQTKVLCQSAARLTVSVQSGETDTSSFRGQKNVLLMRFFILGDSSRDTTFNGVRFKADKGDVINGQSYSLFVDMDYNGTAETGLKRGVIPANGVIDFRDLPGGGQIISANRTMTMELRTDIALSPISNVLRTTFDTASPAYIIAEASDGALTHVATNGVCATTTCQINVTASPARTVNIVSAGSLYVTRDAEVIRSRQLQGGTVGDSVLRLNFRSPDEEAEITQLQISTWDTAGASVESLELYTSDGTAPFAVATVGGCASEPVLTTNPVNGKVIRTYCASMQNKELLVPTYWDVDVIVRPRMRSDENGGVSGEPLTFWLPARPGVVKARGTLSQTSIADNDGDMVAEGEVFIGVTSALPGRDVIGNPNQSVLSKIMTVTNSAPNPGYVINYEAQEVGRFKFTMPTNNNVRNGLNKPVITDLLFSVMAPNITMDTSTFQTTSSLNYNDRFPCSAYPGSTAGEMLVECRNLPFEVLPSVDISLLVDIPSVGPSSWVQTTLKNFSDATATSFGTGPGQSRIRWQDTDIFAKDIFWMDLQSPNIPSTQFRGLSQ